MPVEEIVRLAAHPKVVAIGEAGLDYFYDKSPREAQARAFAATSRRRSETRTAAGHPCPRCRCGHGGNPGGGDGARAPSRPCCTASRAAPELARRGAGAWALRLVLGHPDVQEVGRAARDRGRTVPLDRLLVETDAPYLAPGKYRGKRNEPAYVVETAEELAKVKGVSQAELAHGHDGEFLPALRQDAAGRRWPHEHALHDPGLRLLGRRAARRQRLGQLRSDQSQEPPPALRAAGRAVRQAGAHDRAGRHAARPARAAAGRARRALSTPCSSRTTTPTTRTASTICGACSSSRNAAFDIYADAATRRSLESRFDYCFVQQPGSSYPAILEMPTSIRPCPCASMARAGRSKPCRSCRSTATSPSLGFRFGSVAYSPDISGIPEASVPLLQGLDVWIVDALRPVPHPSHFSVKQALQWIERLGVKRAILTHMTVELDYDGAAPRAAGARGAGVRRHDSGGMMGSDPSQNRYLRSNV